MRRLISGEELAGYSYTVDAVEKTPSHSGSRRRSPMSFLSTARSCFARHPPKVQIDRLASGSLFLLR